jgi:hypothetical protein
MREDPTNRREDAAACRRALAALSTPLTREQGGGCIQSGDGWSWVSGREKPDAGESMRGQARPPLVWGQGMNIPVARVSASGQGMGVQRELRLLLARMSLATYNRALTPDPSHTLYQGSRRTPPPRRTLASSEATDA